MIDHFGEGMEEMTYLARASAEERTALWFGGLWLWTEQLLWF